MDVFVLIVGCVFLGFLCVLVILFCEFKSIEILYCVFVFCIEWCCVNVWCKICWTNFMWAWKFVIKVKFLWVRLSPGIFLESPPPNSLEYYIFFLYILVLWWHSKIGYYVKCNFGDMISFVLNFFLILIWNVFLNNIFLII